MGVKALTRVQYGLEAVNGTAVAADTILLCTAALTAADREVHIPTVDAGVRTAQLLDYAVVRRAHASGITLADADGAYFELFPLLFSSCLNGNVVAAEQTSGEGDYLWTFTAPQTGAEDLDTFTLEIGADDPAAATAGHEVAYCLVESMTISGDCVSGEVHVSANVAGDEVIQTTVTGAIALPTAELCVGRLSRIYVDNTWAGLGSNEIANSLINWSVTINGGGHHKFWGGTVRHPSGHQQGYISGSAQFTFERNAAVRAEEAYYRAGADTYTQTERFVEILVTGNQIGSGEVQSLTLDMAGLWTDWQVFGAEENMNSLDVATLTFGYDATGAQGIQALVSTTLAAI